MSNGKDSRILLEINSDWLVERIAPPLIFFPRLEDTQKNIKSHTIKKEDSLLEKYELMPFEKTVNEVQRTEKKHKIITAMREKCADHEKWRKENDSTVDQEKNYFKNNKGKRDFEKIHNTTDCSSYLVVQREMALRLFLKCCCRAEAVHVNL